MTKDEQFSISSRLRSFVYAFSGIRYFFFSEHNAWIHAAFTVAVIILSAVMRLSGSEWIAIVFSIAFVWITEMINTAIEKIMDHLSPAQHPQVKIIKDISAGAVVIAAIAAVIVAFIIFIPKFI